MTARKPITGKERCATCGHIMDSHAKPFSMDLTCQVKGCECYRFEPREQRAAREKKP